MTELESKIQQLGATDLLTLTQTLNELIVQHEDAKLGAWRLRLPSTVYKAGDKVIVPGVGNFDKILRCETNGITADATFPADYNALEVGNVVTDGTVEWGVVNLFSMPDIAGAPVTSVNGKTGDVNLTAQNVGADPAGTAARLVSEHNTATDVHKGMFDLAGTATEAVAKHNTAEDAHKTLFDKHRAEKASKTQSGHVKVDGDTITATEDGTIKSSDNVDFIIEHLEEKLADGGFMWCDTYRSGKIVQGGLWMGTESVGKAPLTMLKEMPDTNYSIHITPAGLTHDNLGVSGMAFITPSKITTSGFELYETYTAATKNKYWRAEWRMIGK